MKNNADICAVREIELREQELRAYVIRRSLIRIDCVAALMLALIGVASLGIGLVRSGHLIVPSILFAALVVAVSAKNILAAVGPRR